MTCSDSFNKDDKLTSIYGCRCENGYHNWNKKCVSNSDKCKEYDPATGNCARCEWYSWMVRNENNPSTAGNGNWCENRWWLWLLIALGALFLLGILGGIICYCCCGKKKKKTEAKPLKPVKQEVVVQRARPVEYRQPVPVKQEIIVEKPQVRHEYIVEQAPVRTEYIVEPAQVRHEYVKAEPIVRQEYVHVEPEIRHNKEYIVEQPVVRQEYVHVEQPQVVQHRVSSRVQEPVVVERTPVISNNYYSDVHVGQGERINLGVNERRERQVSRVVKQDSTVIGNNTSQVHGDRVHVETRTYSPNREPQVTYHNDTDWARYSQTNWNKH